MTWKLEIKFDDKAAADNFMDDIMNADLLHMYGHEISLYEVNEYGAPINYPAPAESEIQEDSNDD